jgi:hypothetical protein
MFYGSDVAAYQLISVECRAHCNWIACTRVSRFDARMTEIQVVVIFVYFYICETRGPNPINHIFVRSFEFYSLTVRTRDVSGGF